MGGCIVSTVGNALIPVALGFSIHQAPAVFYINAVSFVIFLVGLSVAERRTACASGEDEERLSLWRQARDVASVMSTRRGFTWALFVYAIGWLLIVQPFLILGAAAVRAGFDGQAPLVWGAVSSCLGLGGVLGARFARHVTPHDPMRWSVLSSLLDVPLFLLLAADVPHLGLLLIVSAMSGVQSSLTTVWLSEAVYREFPPDMIGRASAVVTMAGLAPAFVGTVLSAVLESCCGPRGSLHLLAAVFAVVVVVVSFRMAGTT